MSIDAVLTETSAGFDFSIDSNGDIETETFFDTAIMMSIFCERRASPSEVGESHRRRGWIGNEQGDNFEIGSKVWLFEQARLTNTTLAGIRKAAFNGLIWLVEDGYALNIETEAVFLDGKITLTVNITRPDSKVEKRFYELWNLTGIR